jgi:hypothetical protein
VAAIGCAPYSLPSFISTYLRKIELLLTGFSDRLFLERFFMTQNPCSRCGQQRIVQKTWVEESISTGGVSKLTHTMMICPDPVCQAALEKNLAKEQDQRIERQRVKDEQTQARLQKPAPTV